MMAFFVPLSYRKNSLLFIVESSSPNLKTPLLSWRGVLEDSSKANKFYLT
jgi:hypothetical protein